MVSRAWEVLADLEKNGGRKTAARKRRPRESSSAQIPLFASARSLVEEVRDLDIPNLTPLEAINRLYELQQKAREAEQLG